MATEFRLNYTGSEINQKLEDISNIKLNLNNNYYTSEEIDSIINETFMNKADLVDGKVPLEQLPDDIGSGGGLTEVSWEDIKDKPFYDTRIMSYYSQAENPNPVSFHNQMMNYSFYKISDLTPTREQIFGELKILVNDSEITLAENAIIMELDGCLAVGTSVGTSYTFFFTEVEGTINFTFSGYPMTLEVPETGIYAILPLNSGVPTNRTYEFICGGELKTLDLKYLPKNMALGYEEKGKGVTWDGNTKGLTEAAIELEADGTLMKLAYYKVSDETPSIDEVIGKQLRAIIEGKEETAIISEDMIMVFSDNGSYLINDVSVAVCLNANTVLPCTEMIGAPEDIIFPEEGIWFADVSAAGVSFTRMSALTSPDTLVPIDEKFIPDTIARQSDLNNIDLSNYYTKNETYDSWTIDNKIANVKVDLSGYYTKSEVDEMLGDIDAVINEINALIGE